MRLRNPLATQFQADCQAWYRHRTGHNYAGRQQVTILLARRYSGLLMARHIRWIGRILDAIENQIRKEYGLPPLPNR